MYLFYLARELTGGNILELGPFVGGTTRALARGIEHSGIAGRRLVTVDQFDKYYDVATFKQLGVRVTGEDGKMVKFRAIFEEFHRNESYYPYIDARSIKVADLPSESTDYAFLEGLHDLLAVFIDGCKSWYSVKDFVSNVVGRTDAGTYYLFQDYGRYTCFWIPAFVESFPAHFRFVGAVDATFIYRLAKPLTANEIAAVFPDQPHGMNAADMDSLFARVFDREKAEHRPAGMVTIRIQAAAFHAYVGDKAKASQLLEDLLRQDFVRGNLRSRVREALISPTYSPDGKIRL